MSTFTSKVVLITGAASGIGEATATLFAEKGASLSLIDRNEGNLKQVKEKCRKLGAKQVLAVVADLRKEADIKRSMEETIEKFHQLDILVNNAGVGSPRSLEQEDISQFDFIFHINVKAHFYFTQLAVPHLEKTKGAVVNVSSICGLLPTPKIIFYGMSKAAMDQFTRSAALDLAEKGIRVNSVNPTYCQTNLGVNSMNMPVVQQEAFFEQQADKQPLGRTLVEKEDIAKAILYLASDAAKVITGTCLTIDRGRALTGSTF